MNYLLIIVILVLVWRMVVGFKQGMVKELQAFVTFLVSSCSIVLICKAVNAYLHSQTVSMIVAILLLIILGVGFRILKLVFFSAKTIAKLPVVHLADKILGIVMGAAEVLAMLWAFFLVLDTFSTGIFARIAAAYINDNTILTYLYSNNLLEKIFQQLTSSVAEAL